MLLKDKALDAGGTRYTYGAFCKRASIPGSFLCNVMSWQCDDAEESRFCRKLVVYSATFLYRSFGVSKIVYRKGGGVVQSWN